MTQALQTAKDLIRDYTHARDRAQSAEEIATVMSRYMAPDHRYRGVRPFYEINDPTQIASMIWAPLHAACNTLQRRPDILFASHPDLQASNGLWVVEMGNLLFDFTAPWLGIPATGKTSYLPYATLSRISGGKIVETVEFLDLLAVLTQAGQNRFQRMQSGGHLMLPGPKTHDGLVRDTQPAAASKKTYDLSVAMLDDLAKAYRSPADHMVRFWHDDMNWFGPTGIGSSLGFSGYRRGHTDPFETKLEAVEIHDWELAVAEGAFSAVMWWPCLSMRNIDGYMGVPSNPALAQMRVVDLYRRDGDKLAENWIFIDMLHFLSEQGVDLLAELGDNHE